jgi:hypothetical protein
LAQSVKGGSGIFWSKLPKFSTPGLERSPIQGPLRSWGSYFRSPLGADFPASFWDWQRRMGEKESPTIKVKIDPKQPALAIAQTP